MEIKAHLNYLHIAPRKARQVINTVRGLGVERAHIALRHLPRKSSTPLLKLLHSAIANAEHNFHVAGTELYVKSIKVDQGPVLKRFMPRAFGRAATIRKRSCHISLVLATRGDVRNMPRETDRKEIPIVAAEDTTREDSEQKRSMMRKNLSSGKKTDAARRKGFVKKIFSRKVV